VVEGVGGAGGTCTAQNGIPGLCGNGGNGGMFIHFYIMINLYLKIYNILFLKR